MNQRKPSGWAPEADETPLGDPVDVPPAVPQSSGLFDLAGHVLSEGRAYAETEIERQKLRASILAVAGRDSALLALSALFLLFGALTTLLIGCVWILAPLIGVVAALAVTLVVTFVVVLLLLGAAKARMKKAMRLVFGEEDAA